MNDDRTNELLAQIETNTRKTLEVAQETQNAQAETLEATREAVGVLHGIEALVDNLLVATEFVGDTTAESAYRSHGVVWRIIDSWKQAREVIELTEMEAQIDRHMKYKPH